MEINDHIQRNYDRQTDRHRNIYFIDINKRTLFAIEMRDIYINVYTRSLCDITIIYGFTKNINLFF